VLFVFAVLIIVPLVFTTIADVKTLDEAESILKSSGCTNIEYIDWIDDAAVLNLVFEGNTTVTDYTHDDLGFYLFKTDKENIEYCLAVNVIGGEILGETLVESNPYIHYYIR
jgi:hypothetical protein